MRTLRKHMILYDAECPMCSLYTGAFVRSGMLDANGREAYQRMPGQICPLVDMQRAVNEIALVNLETGEVKYGIDSLCYVLASNFPVLRPVFSCKPVRWFLGKTYAFVSYNRRVIIPAEEGVSMGIAQPSFRLRYRLLYLLFAWAVTSGILTLYTPFLQTWLPAGEGWREYLVCALQILFQGALLYVLDRRKLWDYLGNMMTVSLAGGLLLLLAMPVLTWLQASPAAYLGVFLGTVGLMFMEHARRCKLLHLGWIPTAGWVFFRLTALFLLLNEWI